MRHKLVALALLLAPVHAKNCTKNLLGCKPSCKPGKDALGYDGKMRKTLCRLCKCKQCDVCAAGEGDVPPSDFGLSVLQHPGSTRAHKTHISQTTRKMVGKQKKKKQQKKQVPRKQKKAKKKKQPAAEEEEEEEGAAAELETQPLKQPQPREPPPSQPMADLLGHVLLVISLAGAFVALASAIPRLLVARRSGYTVVDATAAQDSPLPSPTGKGAGR